MLGDHSPKQVTSQTLFHSLLKIILPLKASVKLTPLNTPIAVAVMEKMRPVNSTVYWMDTLTLKASRGFSIKLVLDHQDRKRFINQSP